MRRTDHARTQPNAERFWQSLCPKAVHRARALRALHVVSVLWRGRSSKAIARAAVAEARGQRAVLALTGNFCNAHTPALPGIRAAARSVDISAHAAACARAAVTVEI